MWDRVTSYCLSAYSASKHAIESFASSLRLELDPFNVIVSVVGPTFARTPLAINAFVGLEKRVEGLDEEVRDVYGVEAMKRLQRAYETNTLTGVASVEVDEVVKTLEETVVRKVPWQRSVACHVLEERRAAFQHPLPSGTLLDWLPNTGSPCSGYFPGHSGSTSRVDTLTQQP